MPRSLLPLLLFAAATTFGAAGCGQARGRRAAKPPAPIEQPANEERANDDEARTPLIRALLEELDDLDVPDEFADDGADKEMLRDILLAADDELADNTGDELKTKIMRANQRRPALIVRPQRFVERAAPAQAKPEPAGPNAEELPPKRDDAE